MAMVSLKMSSKEGSEYGMGGGDYYPGTTLYVDDEVLTALGFKTPPAVGSTFQMTALVEVVRASTSQDGDNEVETSLTMQITDMDLLPATARTPEQRASKLWPNGNKASTPNYGKLTTAGNLQNTPAKRVGAKPVASGIK